MAAGTTEGGAPGMREGPRGGARRSKSASRFVSQKSHRSLSIPAQDTVKRREFKRKRDHCCFPRVCFSLLFFLFILLRWQVFRCEFCFGCQESCDSPGTRVNVLHELWDRKQGLCSFSVCVISALKRAGRTYPLSQLEFYLISTVIAQVPFRGVFCTRDSSGSAAVLSPFIAAVRSLIPLVPHLHVYLSSINGAGKINLTMEMKDNFLC